MGTQPRVGFLRVGYRLGEPPRKLKTKSACSTGKARYSSESDAIEALVRVRRERVDRGDPRPHESHLYPCERCDGFHLSSTPVLRSYHLLPDHPQRETEPLDMYVRRLQNRIAEQRAQILSLLATGNGTTNRESRKRNSTLVMALGRVTELWHEERKNREALVERLRVVESRRRLWRRRDAA